MSSVDNAPCTARRWLGIVGIVGAWIGLTYIPNVGWWCSSAAVVLILAFGFVAFGRRAPERLGFQLRFRDGVWFLAAFCLTLGLAWPYLAWCAARADVLFEFDRYAGRPEWFCYTVFQTLSEEMVVGALLLFALDRRFPRRRWQITLGAALVFSAMHWALYGPLRHPDFIRVHLAPSTLLSLFFVGVLRNNALLSRGNLALAWGIHLGWNTVFFSGALQGVTEPVTFDVVFGRWPTVLLTGALAALSFVLYRRSSARQRGHSPQSHP